MSRELITITMALVCAFDVWLVARRLWARNGKHRAHQGMRLSNSLTAPLLVLWTVGGVGAVGLTTALLSMASVLPVS